MYRPRSDGIFPRMRRIPMLLLCVVALPAIFLMVECTDGSSQAGQGGHAPHSDNVKLALLPEHDSGVSGTASFEEISEGVLVKLELRGLPKRSFQNCSEMLRSEPMAKELVTNELWEIVEPLLPKEPPKPEGGRPRIDDRAALTGIIFVLKSG